MAAHETYKLLVVDDSRLIRKAMCSIFEDDGTIQVVGEAENGAQALEKLEQLNPDVISLDITMPVMDGLTALKHIMIRYPRPTVMLSALTHDGAEATFDSLKYGAIDFIPKPSRLSGDDMEARKKEIRRKISLAAQVDMGTVSLVRTSGGEKKTPVAKATVRTPVMALGASEGGYGSLIGIITRLNPDLPSTLVAMIYSDPKHVDAFIAYLDRNSPIPVKRAVQGEPLYEGVCYVAPGSDYVTLLPGREDLVFHVDGSPFPSRKGSVNMLMLSLADTLKERAAGVVLSGTGDDGAEGLAEIHNRGGLTLVQAPGTCLAKEMPRAAIKACQAHLVVSGKSLADKINDKLRQAHL